MSHPRNSTEWKSRSDAALALQKVSKLQQKANIPTNGIDGKICSVHHSRRGTVHEFENLERVTAVCKWRVKSKESVR